MDKGDVEMLDAENNVPASDVLVSNESPVKYENGVKTGKSNVEDLTDDQSDSKGEDLNNARRETEDKLKSKSQPEAHDNMVLENKTPTIDAGMDEMASGYVKVTDDEVQNIDKGEVNEVHQSEKMIYAVNQNGNDLTVARQEDPQMEANPTTVTTNGDARSCEFPKVKLEVTDSSITKMPEPASPMFLINSSTANAGQHSGEAFENISAMMTDGEDDEGSPEDQAAFLGKLRAFYREKAMEFKPPKFYGYQLNFLKLWRSVIRLGGYDRILLQYERHRTQNGELQLPIAPPPGSSGVDNEGSGYQISASGSVVRDSATRCRLGWQEQHLLGYGEVVEPIVKDRSAYNTPKRANSLKTSGGSGYQISASGRAVRDSAARSRLGWQEQHLLGYGEVAEPIVKDKSAYNTPKHAKSLKTSGSHKHEGQNEVEHPMKAAETETSKQLDVPVIDVGPSVDWVKINVRETQNDSFEVYALVPGLLREEVRVQSDPAGRLVITGQPNQLDNLWGITAFKKAVTLPARIYQLRTNDVVSLHGCLHVHVLFAQQNI